MSGIGFDSIFEKGVRLFLLTSFNVEEIGILANRLHHEPRRRTIMWMATKPFVFYTKYSIHY
jgi:hypothetical protein